jgi:Flp pilus assembly pilin Flp
MFQGNEKGSAAFEYAIMLCLLLIVAIIIIAVVGSFLGDLSEEILEGLDVMLLTTGAIA